jgi:hypothetical protein
MRFKSFEQEAPSALWAPPPAELREGLHQLRSPNLLGELSEGLRGPFNLVHAQENVAVSEITLSPWWLRRVAYVFRFPQKTN